MEQIKYATFDAYASFLIRKEAYGRKLGDDGCLLDMVFICD